jgi:CheY-like chemotaxis protein
MINHTTPIKPLKILMIEDTSIILHLQKVMLSKLGYKPDCATCGEEAIRLFKSNEYDLVLTDIGLPDSDGFLLTEQFREIEALESRKKSYIVAITAFVLDEVKSRYLASKMDDIISKPLKEEVLRGFIERASVN